MNIVFLCRLYKPHVGGVEKHVEEISKILSKKHSITVITEQNDPILPLEVKYPEAKIYRIPVSNNTEKNKKWAIWQWIWHNRQLLYNAEIVHIHDVFYWVVLLLPFFIKSKLFITFHGFEGHNPGVKEIFWHKLAQWLTVGNICIGSFHQKWYHVKPDVVSYGGVRLTTHPKVKTSNKAVFVGRLDKDTGIMDYLKASLILKLPLDIFGDGPLFSLAKQTTGMSKYIKFQGYTPNASDRIQNYKISFVSGYLSILDSLQSRIPVVAFYDIPLKFDYLSDTPFVSFINLAESASEIIKAYQNIRSNPKLTKSQIESGYNWVIGQTWDKLAGQYEQLWQKPENNLLQP